MSLEDRIREAVESFVARARQDLDVHGQGLAVDLTSALRDQIEHTRADLDRAVSAERTRADADLTAFKEKLKREHASGFGRLLGTIRELDGAISLRGILEALAAGVKTETVRSALLLLDTRTFRALSAFGYTEGQTPTEVMADADTLLVRAVESLAPVEVPSPTRDGGTPLGRPNFLRPPAGHVGRLLPLAVGGNVVAVLYSEGLDARAEGQSGEVWIEAIEILVRHAALRLENVTSIRTVEALTR